MYCCVLWLRALSKFDPKGADLRYREFLLTHHVKRGMGEICSFKGMALTLIVLELRYHKVSDWIGKFFSWPAEGVNSQWDRFLGLSS